MSSFATIEGTLRYGKRNGAPFLKHAFRPLGRTGLLASAIGFGGYRIEEENPEHQYSLVYALKHGCNIVDTSANYTDGSSERCIGTVLGELIEDKSVKRDEIIVVSKVGYLQGNNLDLAKEREAEKKPFFEMVKYMEGCWHCIHPDFISDQLDRSLQRLKLDTIDVYLLHNPEYFFLDAVGRATPGSRTQTEKLRNEFYDRIRRAFERLEEETARGRIRHYGVSSNSFVTPAENPTSTSATQMWEIATQISKRKGDERGHHFSVIQMPINLLEGGAVLLRNNGPRNDLTTLEFSMEKQIGVLANRPLNAFVSNHLARLADFPLAPGVEGIVSEQAKKVSKLEEEFRIDIAPHLESDLESLSPTQFFNWGKELGDANIEAIGMEHWSEIEHHMLRPQLEHISSAMDKQLSGSVNNAWISWRQHYLPEIERLILMVRNECSRKSRKLSEGITRRLIPHLPESLWSESLSRKAMAILIHTPGISSVLNGMRREKYVTDSLGTLKFPPLVVPTAVYESFRDIK